ncbi:hypothetical protein UA08_05499 [Talaromyces atroroseus]|uniref:Uncharacterized protein n=1 Tax=Talaromyces atroroseus TaxID=1441469 RepID=A0A225ACU8_TALAT|nr:hypothetical protein UA08_05499 [Talaromyces atroroseus]OKL58971.1 hypothetical protein UA08_05499 [Talaromyces atroroseus]
MDFNDNDAPPPYSALDPMQDQNTNSSASTGNSHDANQNSNANSSQIETSFSSLRIQASSPSSLSNTQATSPTESGYTTSATTMSTHFTSAGGYFAEQPQPVRISGDTKSETLVHHMTIYARSQGRDFPRRPRCWNARGSEINQHDWDTFLNFLFPPHLGPAASSNRLHRQIRAEIERDRKDRAQETDEERSARINKVTAEWNEQFFSPRGVHVTYTYVADLEEGPTTSLCPNCYPQATDASRARGRLVRTASFDAPIPVHTEAPVRQHTIQRRPVPQTAQPTSQPSPQNPHASPAVSPISPAGSFDQAGTYSSMPLGNRNQASFPWKSAPASWATQMSSIAQLYAAKISNQAQEYGRSIEESALARSRQVELYSKKVEENALARARRLETIALTQGRRIENAGDVLSNWASGIGRRASYAQSMNGPSTREADDSAYETFQSQHRPQERSRRLSAASDTSIASVSSIETVSSLSDLEPDDLASVRQQLTSLDGYHHHELYDAAVSLRNQLQALKKARWNGRFRSQRARPWGRWESPAEAAEREQRRIAMKRETKLLREKFSEIERRAKREVRELQKSRKEMRKKQHRHLTFRSQQQQQQQQQQHATFPPTMGSTLNGEYRTQSPSESLNRASSEPIHRSESNGSNSPMPSVPLDPHEAAKAWAESQRARVKEIKRANKERIKEIQKSYKEHEKQQRKAIKKLNKQKPSLTMSIGSGSVASSSSLALGETGTIQSGVSSSTGIMSNDGVATHSISREGSGGASVNRGQDFRQQESDAAFQIPELDGNPLKR